VNLSRNTSAFIRNVTASRRKYTYIIIYNSGCRQGHIYARTNGTFALGPLERGAHRLQPYNILFNKNPDRKEINNQIKNLQSMYTNELDLDPDNFADEWFQFHSLISSHQISRNPAA